MTSSRSPTRAARSSGARERSVLIACGPGDSHAIAVALRLEELGVRAVPLDLARLPAAGLSAWTSARGSVEVLLGTIDGPIDPAACVGVWWRRPQPVEAPASEPGLRRLAENEWRAALDGLAHVVGGFWVNPPAAQEVARRKLVQLAAARAAGLRVPRTLVTNDLGQARAFLRECRPGGVLKSLSSVREGGLTRRVTARDPSLAERLRVGPAILQERVDGIDVRVTIVGDEVFAMAVDARDGPGRDDVRIDWDRLSGSARQERLPPALTRGLLALQRRLGLRFGALDLRRDDAGRYAFLEVNPAGQWLHAEAATGHPIGATLARLLASGGREARSPGRARARP